MADGLQVAAISSQDSTHYTDDSGDRPCKIPTFVQEGAILYAEDSLISRRGSLQGGLAQCESTMKITNGCLEVGVHLPKVKRDDYAGTSTPAPFEYYEEH